MSKRLCEFVCGRCPFAERAVYWQSREFICRTRVDRCTGICLFARGSARLQNCRVHLQPAVRICMATCLLAAAYCMYAQLRVCFHVRSARLHTGVIIYKRPYICTERHACLHALNACVQTLVFICTSIESLSIFPEPARSHVEALNGAPMFAGLNVLCLEGTRVTWRSVVALQFE